MKKFSIIIEFMKFLAIRKKYWLLPIVLTLMILGALLIISEGSVVAPFIYAIF